MKGRLRFDWVRQQGRENKCVKERYFATVKGVIDTDTVARSRDC